jgi:hypothetical protein
MVGFVVGIAKQQPITSRQAYWSKKIKAEKLAKEQDKNKPKTKR